MKKTFALLVFVGVAIFISIFFVRSGSGGALSGDSSQTYVFKTAERENVGTYLVSANGMALYISQNDRQGLSTCSEQCAKNWIPYAVSTSAPLSVDPVVTGVISMLERADGTTQMTYNGLPLYRWKGDVNPGEVSGQNIDGVWSVARP